ncbi:HD domain-containing protein [Thermosediminibacter litoriperuensis]|uniref:Putative nucleotidyltransferase with HDIG domain n=1 Tax=Thermosediminibacter litoriperuensis TaxID=291989 RepID=A0A5S5ACX8_9FIRM|nr:putative nucleotidyltransferase with HDIG domain [Thermosediminibacter litoriperuensis]
MTREEALELVKENVSNKNLVKHMIAAEAVMRRLARHFGEDEEKWGLTGLLHDVDFDRVKDDLSKHSLVGGQMAREWGLDEEVAHAIEAHNEEHGIERNTLLSKAMFAVDPLTGLIVASALIHPEKKLSAIDTQFVINRFYEKSFARGASREKIATCSELNLTLEEFVSMALEAMQEIHKELGL